MNTNKKECGCCGTSKSTAQFHKSPMDSRKFLPICKLCCKEKLKAYTEITGSESAAMWLVLSELGVPFIQDIWDKFEIFKANANVNTDLVMAYIRILNESGMKVDGFWQSDVMLDMLMDSVVDREVVRKSLDLSEQQKIWGKFMADGELDVEAYEILNRAFEKYTKDLEEPDENYEERIRDLCKCELRLRRANEFGDGAEISKAQDSLNKQLAMLKMNEFQSNFKSEEQRFFEKKIAMIEHYRPAECEDLTKFLDKVGYEKDKAIPMRSIRNAIQGTREYPDIPKEEQ